MTQLTFREANDNRIERARDLRPYECHGWSDGLLIRDRNGFVVCRFHGAESSKLAGKVLKDLNAGAVKEASTVLAQAMLAGLQ